jgi:hypothetical protein
MIEGSTEILDFNLYFSDKQNENEITGLQLFMQEIELLMKIKENIWGNTFFIDLEKYVFNKYISTEHIRQEIVSAVSKNCTQSNIFSYTIEIKMIKLDESKDMLYICFNLFDTDSDRTFMQKFTITS